MSVFAELRKSIARVTRCSEDAISMDTALKDIKADSLHWVQIIVAMENAFDIEVDFEKMKEMTTIGDFVQYIESINK